MMDEDIRITKMLKEEEWLSTSKISVNLGMNYWKSLRILQEMEQEGSVISKEGLKGRFWKLNEK